MYSHLIYYQSLLKLLQYLLMFGFNLGDLGGFQMGHDDDDHEEMDLEANNSRLYELLGVDKEATNQQITAAFKKLEEEHNKASQPDHQKFEDIKQAYEVLSNPKDREMYDRFGEQGPSQADMMQMFFGGGAAQKGPKQKQKSQPLKQLLEITLEQTYKGDNVDVPVKRYRLCKSCNGQGGSDAKKCTQCKGNGHIVRMVPLGPGMMQQIAQPCQTCQGEGRIIAEEAKCKDCNAKQIKQEQVTLNVKVPKGIVTQQPIVVPGQGHQLPDCLVGDAIFVVKVLPHQVFTRNGNDLLIVKQILLIEGITGVVFNLTHLDEKVYTIQSAPKQIIVDKSKKIIRGLGMPFFKNPTQFGDLVIQFHLIMPQKGSISQDNIKQLAAILPGKLAEKPKDHHFELLQDYDPAELNANEQGGGGNEDDDDDGGQGGGVQCASQ